MKKTQLAWVAGIVDGEGCIYATPRGQLRLQVGMSHLPTIERLHEIFPTSNIRNHTQQNPKWKNRFFWLVTNERAITVLKEILPYMVTKEAEAIVALGLESVWTGNCGGSGAGRRSVPPETMEVRLRIYQELRDLKQISYPPVRKGRITKR